MKQEQLHRLETLADALPEDAVDQLLDYAQFLVEKYGQVDESAIPREPLDLPRPEQESVVLAIQRLTATYPMLDTAKLLNESSELMSSHILRGRDAVSVIDDLESLFGRYYEKYITPDSD